ncbi:MAG: hypothetical protein ACE5JX_11235 [Acidobacteriota bacterium]
MRVQVVIGLNAVIAAVTAETPRILTIPPPAVPLSAADVRPAARSEQAPWGLPFGPLDPVADRTLELGLRRWVREQTGIELGYVEQLYTFGDRNRSRPLEGGGARVISAAYLALIRETPPPHEGASWQDWYRFFPFEDWREGPPRTIEAVILPALDRWLGAARDRAQWEQRRERLDICFGCRGAQWGWERVLDRYELLYEAGLVPEARRDRLRKMAPPILELQERVNGESGEKTVFGTPMILDHRRILATALGRIRGKLRYRPVVFELLPPTFTLLQLQKLVEALAGLRLHKQNFRRLVEKGGLVEGTRRLHRQTGGRPAELFRFRREVLRERPAPGVGLPGLP